MRKNVVFCLFLWYNKNHIIYKGKAWRLVENEEKREDILPVGNNQDAIFRSMMRALENFNQIETKEGDIVYQIILLVNALISCKADKAQLLIAIRRLAANYFTEEKIRELCKKTIDILKCKDLDENKYINEFSDSRNIEFDDIIFLLHREEELKRMEDELNQEPIQQKSPKEASFWGKLVDILGRGNTNDA